MSKNENKLNKINSQKSEGFEDNNFLETSQNQSRNKKNEKNKKENNSRISTKEIAQRIFTIDEENVLVKIIENHNNSSISKICEFFNHSNLNYSKIHSKTLYNNNEDNFIYNNIIKNNNRRISIISEKLSSMKNPNEISTKESILCGYINNKIRNYNKNNFENQVKLSCCFFNED
jgi:hypothetical protein